MNTQAFLAHIYNDEYVLVDPDYVVARPTNNAKVISETFHASRNFLSILDFGGGNGLLASTLVQNGFNATTYDPFSAFAERPTGRFNLITCFEVMEHSPFPGRTVSEMSHLLADDGIILFSTLTQPANFDDLRLHWWYASPRNGHVSLYTRRSLTLIFQQHDLQLVSLSDLLHVAFRELPAFATHLETRQMARSCLICLAGVGALAPTWKARHHWAWPLGKPLSSAKVFM